MNSPQDRTCSLRIIDEFAADVTGQSRVGMAATAVNGTHGTVARSLDEASDAMYCIRSSSLAGRKPNVRHHDTFLNARILSRTAQGNGLV